MTPEQTFLFDDLAFEKNTNEGLILTGGRGRPLTKAQRAFNRLVSRIENLRAELKDTTAKLEGALASYVEQLLPREQRQDALRKELIRMLAVFLEGKQLRQRDRRTLCSVLAAQFDAFYQDPLHEEDLRVLYERIHNVNIDELEQENIKEMRGRFEGVFADLGIDIDVPDFPPGMTEEEFAAIAATLEDEFQRKSKEADAAQQAAGRGRARTRKQLEREERRRQAEEARQRSIASIYKQLARVLHPDLEQDPERRQVKSTLMQELTCAYRENDLHMLLRLELAWIAKEEGNITRMTEEKLAIYNEVLKEQVQELERELGDLPYHPRFQRIIEGYQWSDPFAAKNREAQSQRLDAITAEIQHILAALHSDNPHSAVITVIQQYRAWQRDERTPRGRRIIAYF